MDYIPALGHDRLTPCFDAFANLLGFGPRRREQIARLLRLRPGERLLDIGCGTGTMLAAVARSRSDAVATGIDVDPAILGIAQRRLGDRGLPARLVRGSAGTLPYADASFDAAVSTLVFHHLPAPVKRQAFAEVRRVLRADGRFLLVDFGAGDALALRLLARLVRACRLPEARTAADTLEGRIPALLAAAGFVSTEVARPYLSVRFWLATPDAAGAYASSAASSASRGQASQR